LRGNPSYHLGYSPHAPYGDLGFSFKKTLKRMKKKSKSAAKSVRKSSAYKKAVSRAKSSTKTIRRSPFTKKVMRRMPAPVKKSTRSIISRSRAQAYKNMSAKQRKALPSFMKPRRRPTPSKPKSVVKRAPVRVNKAIQPRTTKGPRGARGGTGPTGEQGPRGYPGSRGQRGARGLPGKSISTTDRWKHKLEKDEMRRIYQNRMRLGRERNLLINNQLSEMQTRNAILMQRINEQEGLAKKNINNATVYKQWHDFKEAAQESIFPKLGGIDIEDEYIASSVSVLPWLVLGLALITREG